jgi:CheY-like chemotaxis protein
VGSRFWFSLPVKLPQEHIIQNTKDAIHDFRGAQIEAGNAHVLIAEDHPVNQLFLAALLKKFGFGRVDMVENGSEVIEKIACTPYDAIFMDCQMPKQDGYETTRRIRELEQRAEKYLHIPIIAMTANALSSDRDTCLEAGMDEYLSKPLQPEKLKDILKKWFIFSPNVESLLPSSTKQKNTSPPVDFNRLQLVAETETDKAALLTLFFRLAKEFIAIMENARRNEEFTRWRDAAHSLKGSAGNLGMIALVAICQESEMATSLTYDQRTGLLTQIKCEIENIKAYVTEQNPALLSPEV